jgi:hypothetical protein
MLKRHTGSIFRGISMSSDPVAKRVYVTLPDTVADDLQIWAERRDQPLATVAAIAIELYLERLKTSGDLQSSTTAEKTKTEKKD